MVWKRNTVSLRETMAAKAYLEDMAKEGLFLENASVFRGLQFREDAPAEMDYLVILAEGEMSEKEKTAYLDKGWSFVCRYMQIYVFTAPKGMESPEEKTEQYRAWAEKLRKNQKWAISGTLFYFLFVGKRVYDLCCEWKNGDIYYWAIDVYAVSMFLLIGLLFLFRDFCSRAAIREVEDAEDEILTINWQRWRNRGLFMRIVTILYLLLFVIMFALMIAL